MRLSLDVLLSMTPEQALLRVRNASRVSGALCRGLADYVFSLRFVDPSLMVSWGLVAEAAAERTADRSAAGFAQAYFGNSLRVTGDSAGALAALERAEELFGSHPLIYPPVALGKPLDTRKTRRDRRSVCFVALP